MTVLQNAYDSKYNFQMTDSKMNSTFHANNRKYPQKDEKERQVPSSHKLQTHHFNPTIKDTRIKHRRRWQTPITGTARWISYDLLKLTRYTARTTPE